LTDHRIKVCPSSKTLRKQDQLAWKLAEIASDHSPVLDSVMDMVINRIIDNASVAMAAINRPPVANARTQALGHPRMNGATLFGIPSSQTFDAEWAAWANCTAVRELDMHDTFLAADYSHPGDNIPPLLAAAQQCKKTGRDLASGIATAYEVHMSLVKAICLHKHKKDHVSHLCPATVAGLGTLLGLDTDTIYQAIQQAVHISFATRQSRKGEISSWKAYAPAHVGKLAIEAVDRAMRGEKSPSPIYEGEESVIAFMLDGPEGAYTVSLPEPGESKQAILESYTKEHSAEYQAQAFIDLAFGLRSRISDFSQIESITLHTSHHTHHVIGTGANDPQKMDPNASRETLDHSIMYIFAVALQDGRWHHVDSYTPERASRPDTVALWHKIRTLEDPEWTTRYHEADPSRKAFGGRVEICFKDGKKLVDELAVANAHSLGKQPFARQDYMGKFETLTQEILTKEQRSGFLDLVQRLPDLDHSGLAGLNLQINPDRLEAAKRDNRGIF